MPISIDCPHCRQRIRISESMINQRVRCPHCDHVITISVSAAAHNPRIAAEPAIPPPPPSSAAEFEVEYIQRQIRVPAIGLIATGAGTTLMGLLFLPALLFPEANGEVPPRDPVEVALTALFMVLTLAMGIVTLWGAVKMLRQESYAWATTAAIVAMVPWYCCILGLPFGIWALVVLRRPVVKAAFSR